MRGFTVLEMLVVLALAAMLAGFSVLDHQAMRPALDLRMGARQVALDLRLARRRAVAENVTYRVVFATGAGAYQQQRKTASAYVDDGVAIALPRGVQIVDCNATGNGISFKPRGNAATFGTVIIGNRSGEQRRIIVDIAGQVRVQ